MTSANPNQFGAPLDQNQYMEQEEEWEREGLLDPAWEKQQRKVRQRTAFVRNWHFVKPMNGVNLLGKVTVVANLKFTKFDILKKLYNAWTKCHEIIPQLINIKTLIM